VNPIPTVVILSGAKDPRLPLALHEKMKNVRVRLTCENKLEQLRLDALAAWNHYQSTGLHATADEADAWLAKLQDGNGPVESALKGHGFSRAVKARGERGL